MHGPINIRFVKVINVVLLIWGMHCVYLGCEAATRNNSVMTFRPTCPSLKSKFSVVSVHQYGMNC